MPVFIGLDLAWTPHHESGVCILEGDAGSIRLVSLDWRSDTPRAFAAMCDAAGKDVVVGIDAPLIVHPERRAEADLAAVFGKYKAAAYVATLPFLQRMDGLAGPALAWLLRGLGFTLAPSQLTRQAPGRFALEVFPHPAHVVLFGLPERLAYKKGPLSRRRGVLRQYQQHLGTLLAIEMPSVAASADVRALLSGRALDVPGRQLKRIEDLLDAVTCAYVGYHSWRHGPAGFRAFGCDEHGTIVTPWPFRHPTYALEQSCP